MSKDTLSFCFIPWSSWLLITPFISPPSCLLGEQLFLGSSPPLRVSTLEMRLFPFVIFLPISFSVSAHALVTSVSADKPPSCPLGFICSTYLWCVFLLSNVLSYLNDDRPQALVIPSPQASHFAWHFTLHFSEDTVPFPAIWSLYHAHSVSMARRLGSPLWIDLYCNWYASKYPSKLNISSNKFMYLRTHGIKPICYDRISGYILSEIITLSSIKRSYCYVFLT